MRSVTEQNSVSFVVQCRKPRQQDHSKSRRMLTVKEAEQQRQRERLDQQVVSLESERKALEEKIKEDLLRLSQKVVLPATDLQQKKCPNCGGMVAGARFCPKCGYDLNSIKEK